MINIGNSTYKLLILVRDNPEMQLSKTKYAKTFFNLMQNGYTNRIYIEKNGKSDYEYNTVTDKGLDAILEFERQMNSDKKAHKAYIIALLSLIISTILSIVSIVISIYF